MRQEYDTRPQHWEPWQRTASEKLRKLNWNCLAEFKQHIESTHKFSVPIVHHDLQQRCPGLLEQLRAGWATDWGQAPARDRGGSAAA